MYVVRELSSTAHDRYAAYKTSIDNMTCDSVFGVKIHQRNFTEITTILRSKLKELERANQLEVSMLSKILELAISAISSNDGDSLMYRDPLSKMLSKVSDAILATCMMPRDSKSHLTSLLCLKP